MRVVLIRHGESEANKAGIIQGHMDYKLTELGRAQAKEIGKKLLTENYQFDAIYSSDLLRAKETAEIIAKELQIDGVKYDARLREFNLGVFQGRFNRELSKEDKAYINSCWEDHNKRIPEGESVIEMTSRIKNIFSEIITNSHDESTILIIGHGGTLYHILNYILCIYPQTEEWFSNCSFNVLEGSYKTLENWQLKIFNGEKLKD